MKSHVAFFIVCIAAALASALRADEHVPTSDFPGWTDRLGELALTRVELVEEDRSFGLGDDERMARFSSGPRHVVRWWLADASHRVHSLRECYRVGGYTITTLPTVEAFDSGTWGRFGAARDGEALVVYEQVVDADGRTYDDVSAWFWSATFGSCRGPFWLSTVVERANTSD